MNLLGECRGVSFKGDKIVVKAIIFDMDCVIKASDPSDLLGRLVSS